MPEPFRPGRAGRLWLLGRLASARRSVELLDRKRKLLRREHERLTDAVRQTRQRWETACADAERWGLRATVLGGASDVALAAAAVAGRASVDVTWRNTMGVAHPDVSRMSSRPCPRPRTRRRQRRRRTGGRRIPAGARGGGRPRCDGHVVAGRRRRAACHRATPARHRAPPPAGARGGLRPSGAATRRARAAGAGGRALGPATSSGVAPHAGTAFRGRAQPVTGESPRRLLGRRPEMGVARWHPPEDRRRLTLRAPAGKRAVRDGVHRSGQAPIGPRGHSHAGT